MLDRRENYGFLSPPPGELFTRAEQLRHVHVRISCSARRTLRSNCRAGVAISCACLTSIALTIAATELWSLDPSARSMADEAHANSMVASEDSRLWHTERATRERSPTRRSWGINNNMERLVVNTGYTMMAHARQETTHPKG